MALTPLSQDFFARFKRGAGMTDEQHAQALYNSPCISYVVSVVEYVGETHGLTLRPSAIRQAVKDGELAAYKIGNGFHFSPRDVDDWLESLRLPTGTDNRPKRRSDAYR